MEEQPQRQLPNEIRPDQSLYRYLRSFFDTRCVVLKDKLGLRGPNGYAP